MRSGIYRRALMIGTGVTAIGVSMVVGTMPAFAQEAAGATSQDQAAPAPAGQTLAVPAASAGGVANEIVVTGSRIARRDYQANSPIVTVGNEAFENRAAVSVEETLNDLPQFTQAGSSALASSAGTAFTGADQAPGAATLDLRGLGPNRTLVLVNGRRAQPVNAQLVVDVNIIPPSAIKNVEVITGGAAAVYGADAIAGVVNFILRDDFEGLELDGQYGISEAGDGQTKQVSALVGGNFASGRGNAMLGANWSDRGRAYNRKRDFFTDAWRNPATAAGGGGLPLTAAVIGGVNYGVNFDGSLFNTADASNPAAPFKGPFNDLAGGAGFKLNPATPGSKQQSLGYNDPAALVNIPLSRYSLFGSAHYDLTDNIQAFFEGNFTHSQAYAQSFSGTAGNIWALSVPYNPANDDPASPTFGANKNNFYPVSRQLAALLNARTKIDPITKLPVSAAADPWTLNRGLNFLGDLYTETTSNIYQLTAGLRGKVGINDWTWEVYGSHGSTDIVARQPQGAVSYGNLQQLVSGTNSTGGHATTINGPWAANWNSGATFNPNSCTSGIGIFNADGSVPKPGPGSDEGVVVSKDCKDYATLELNNVTMLRQNIVEGTVQGRLFNDWAGEVRFALGATYRDEKFNYAPDTGNSGEQNSTGVVNQIALPKPTSGQISVKELYGELLVPVIRDLPLIKQFDLELGARYSEYSLSGTIWTYKALGDWKVTDWFRLRGGYQRANRAPNIYELFAPVAGGLGNSADPCVNITGNTPAYGNLPSNPNLKNLQQACKALIVRDGGYPYRTLGEDPSAVAQDPALYPNGLDTTRMSNMRWTLAYNLGFPFSIGLTQGNTALESEKGNTITLGAVINSPIRTPLLNRLTFTVDYYSIDLKGTIGAPSGIEIYTQCLNPQYNSRMSAAFGTYTGAQLLEGNPYCALINRYPYDERGVFGAIGSGTDRTYKSPFLNKGGTKTAGIDVTMNWTMRFDDLGLSAIPGAINLNGSANILLKYKEASFAGAPFVDEKGTLENQAFDYKLFGTVNYIWNTGSLGLRGRYFPSIAPSPFTAAGTTGADSHTEFDLFGRYQLTDKIDLRAGVDNLFNARPEIVGATPTNANTGSTLSIYDTIGRAYYVGLKVRM